MYCAVSPISSRSCAQHPDLSLISYLGSAGFWDAAVQEVRAAFEVLGNARRLAAIFEAFIGALGCGHFDAWRKLTHDIAEDMRTQQHLVTHDVNVHMSRYEVYTSRRTGSR